MLFSWPVLLRLLRGRARACCYSASSMCSCLWCKRYSPEPTATLDSISLVASIRTWNLWPAQAQPKELDCGTARPQPHRVRDRCQSDPNRARRHRSRKPGNHSLPASRASRRHSARELHAEASGPPSHKGKMVQITSIRLGSQVPATSKFRTLSCLVLSNPGPSQRSSHWLWARRSCELCRVDRP